MKKIVIAIDGPAASGKGSIARQLAARLGFAHLDTGLLYRAVGLAVLRAGGDPGDAEAAATAAQALDAAALAALKDDPALRADTASVAASKVAAVPEVRAALLKFQQDFCANPPDNKPGAVLDGRDIGTIIAPHAAVKIYVTASLKTRAERRFKELQSRGEKTDYEAVFKDMEARDARDQGRSTAPLRPADDAVVLDTSDLTAEQALQKALEIAQTSLGNS